jgi:5-methylcytosine-specific restriction protein A
MLFCRTGWMLHYHGVIDGDHAQGNAAFIQNGFGYEVYNFQTYQGNCYGYVQPVARHSRFLSAPINLGRIDVAADGADSINNVTVVWCAPHPHQGGIRVVGWYLNAIVYRHAQYLNRMDINQQYIDAFNEQYAEEFENPPPDNINYVYRISTNAENKVLVIPQDRTFIISKGQTGYMGQSQVWYADSQEGMLIRQQVQHFINNYNP